MALTCNKVENRVVQAFFCDYYWAQYGSGHVRTSCTCPASRGNVACSHLQSLLGTARRWRNFPSLTAATRTPCPLARNTWHIRTLCAEMRRSQVAEVFVLGQFFSDVHRWSLADRQCARIVPVVGANRRRPIPANRCQMPAGTIKPNLLIVTSRVLIFFPPDTAVLLQNDYGV